MSETSRPRPPARLAGVWWMIAASASFSVMGALVKAAQAGLGTTQIVFWRSAVIAVVAHLLLRRAGVPVRPGHPSRMAARCTTGLAAMLCFFWSVGELPLGTATALQYTSPLFTVLLAGPVLGDPAGRRGLLLAAVAFAGVLLILRPALDVGWLPLAAGLAGGLLAAGAYLAVRGLRATDPPARIVWWFAVSSAAVTAPFAFTAGLPAGAQWALVLGVGLFAALGQMGMTQAYRLERPAVVGPIAYATVVFSTAAGVVFFEEALDAAAVAGTLVFVGAGAVLSRGAAATQPRKINRV